MALLSTISARQIKAGRALLDWSQEELADSASLSVTTIRKMEMGHISPRQNTVQLVQKTMEAAGIEFSDSEGVKRRSEDIFSYVGEEGIETFFNDIEETIGKTGGDILITSPSEDVLARVSGSKSHKNFARILKQNDSTLIKCLLSEMKELPLSTPRFEFRMLSKNYIDTISFYVYGNKFALLVLGCEPFPKIIVVQSELTAQSFRRQFYSMWDKALSLIVVQAEDAFQSARAIR